MISINYDDFFLDNTSHINTTGPLPTPLLNLSYPVGMDTLRFAIIEGVSLKWKVNGEINGFTSTWYVKSLKTSIGVPVSR